jgi:hypothetical protein
LRGRCAPSSTLGSGKPDGKIIEHTDLRMLLWLYGFC